MCKQLWALVSKVGACQAGGRRETKTSKGEAAHESLQEGNGLHGMLEINSVLRCLILIVKWRLLKRWISISGSLNTRCLIPIEAHFKARITNIPLLCKYSSQGSKHTPSLISCMFQRFPPAYNYHVHLSLRQLACHAVVRAEKGMLKKMDT